MQNLDVFYNPSWIEDELDYKVNHVKELTHDKFIIKVYGAIYIIRIPFTGEIGYRPTIYFDLKLPFNMYKRIALHIAEVTNRPVLDICQIFKYVKIHR